MTNACCQPSPPTSARPSRTRRLYQETQRRAEEMAAVAEVGREVSATLELQSVLERSRRPGTRAVQRPRHPAAPGRAEDGQTFRTLVALGRYADEFKARIRSPSARASTATSPAAAGAEVINDVTADDRAPSTYPARQSKKKRSNALMIAPLHGPRRRQLGLMAVYRERSQGGTFSQVDLDFLGALARQAAIGHRERPPL